MLPDHPVYPALPTADLDRLRRFYEDTLGFTVRCENPRTIYYRAGDGTFFALARSGGRPGGARTPRALLRAGGEGGGGGLRPPGGRWGRERTPKAGPRRAGPGGGRGGGGGGTGGKHRGGGP